MNIDKKKLKVLAHQIVKELHCEIDKYRDCMESPHNMESIICKKILEFEA